MDRFNKKLEQTNDNASLLRQVFEELEQQLEAKLIESVTAHEKIPELKLLWNHCGHAKYPVALEACRCVVNLTLKGQLGIDESMAALIANIPTARYYGLITDSIAELMVRGSGMDPARHPFITLYEMQPDTWPYIAQQASSIVSNQSLDGLSFARIRPFVIYCLCKGLKETRSSLWPLLVGKLNDDIELCLVDWLLESLLWQPKGSDLFYTNFYLTGVQQLAELAILRRNEPLAQVLAVLLTSAMHVSHKSQGFGIQHSVILLGKLNDSFHLFLEPIVAMLSQFLLECHANCYPFVLDLCEKFAVKGCNPYVWSMLQFAVLSIFSYSDKMESSVVRVVESQPLDRSGSHSISTNKYYRYLIRAEISIQTALAIADLARHHQENCSRIRSISPRYESGSMPDAVFLFRCGVFLNANELPVLEQIVSHVSKNKQHANPLLNSLLKKLTLSSNGRMKLAILYNLPAMAVDKLCVPRVLQIVEALSTSPGLQPVRIKLLAELWKVEDRVYPYLEKMLLNEQLQTDEFLMAKASAIQTVCSTRADKYGSELLSVISELLNSSLGKSHSNSAVVATLALSSLVSLCRAEVVDLKSVWDLLAPKLSRDDRKVVVIEVCNMLSLVPQLRIDNEEYDSFIRQSIATLFRISLTATAPEVISSALRALTRFRKEDFHLKCMPGACKEGLKVPAKYLPADKTEAVVKAEDVLDHVPGVCWVKLMDCYDADTLQTAYLPLLLHLVRLEIQSMPVWVYKKAASEGVKKNEPANYSSSLKEDSVLAALVHHMQRICDINDASQLRMSIALQVLAGPFEKPLPPLDWTVLRPIVQQYKLESAFLEIVFAHSHHSHSAQTIAENVLTSDPLDCSLAVVALSHLGPICKAVPLKYVQDFLSRLLNDHQSELVLILESLQRALTGGDPVIPSEVKHTIAETLLCLLPLLPEDVESVCKFANCFRLISGPDRAIEPCESSARRYTLMLLSASKQSQTKVAIDYLHKALQLTNQLARLEWDVVELICQCVELHCKLSPNFLQQYMSYVQLVAIQPISQQKNFTNLMDVFCLVVSVLSDSLAFHHTLQSSIEERQFDKAWDIFPLAVGRLFSQSIWATIHKSMLDWILTMAQSETLSEARKAKLIEALPAISPIDKETFMSKILPLL